MNSPAIRIATCVITALLIVLLTPSQTEYSAHAISEARAFYAGEPVAYLSADDSNTFIGNVKSANNVDGANETNGVAITSQYPYDNNHDAIPRKVKGTQTSEASQTTQATQPLQTTSLFAAIANTLTSALHSVSNTLRAAVLTVLPASEPQYYDNTAPPERSIFPPEAGVLARGAVVEDGAPAPTVPEHPDWHPLAAPLADPAPALNTAALNGLVDALATLTNIVASLARERGSAGVLLNDRVLVSMSKSTNNRLASSGGTLTGDLTGTTGTFDALTSGTLAAANLTGTGTSSIAALGIGTTSPSDTLALNGAAFLADIAAPSNTASRLYANSGSLYWAGNVIGGATTGSWTSDGTNVWRAGGKVGIGTVNPTYALDVAGAGRFTGPVDAANFVATSSGATSLFNGALTVSGNTTLGNATTTSLFVSSALSASTAAFGATATSTFGTDGSLTLASALAASSGGTGLASVSAAGVLLGNYTGTGWQQLATSSLGLLTTNVGEGTNLYWTDTRFDDRLAASTTLNNLTTANQLGTLKTTLSGVLKASSGILSAASAGADYENPLTFTYPLSRSVNTVSLGFGTTTGNTWAGTQTFTNPPVFSSLASAGLAVTSSGAVYAAATTTAGSGLTYSSGSFNVNTTQNIAKLFNLSANGFVRTSGGDGTLSVDTSTYLTGNQTITLSGDVSGSGSTAITTTIGTNKVTASMLAQIAANTILGNPTGATGNVQALATSSLGIALADTIGTLAISRGGTNAASFGTTNGVIYYDGTRLTNGSGFIFTGTNVGIGTTTPLAKVFVEGAGLIVKGSLSSATNLVNYGGTGSIGLDTAGSLGRIWTDSASSLAFYPGVTEAVRFLTNGNVGIASTTAWGKLTVQQTGTAGEPSFIVEDQAGDTSPFVIDQSGNVGIGSTTPGTLLSLGNTGDSTVNLSATATSTFGFGLNLRAGCYALNGNCLGFGNGTMTGVLPIGSGGTNASSFTTTNNAVYYDGTRLTTADTSQGVTVPYASSTALTVSGTAFFPGSGVWNSSGNVGIGSTTPFGKLSYRTAANTNEGYFGLANGTGVITNQIISQAGAGGTGLDVYDANGLSNSTYPFTVSNNTGAGATKATIFAITNAGNIGIGTTSPGGLLEVGNSAAGSILANITNSNTGTVAFAELNLRNDYAAQTGLRILTMGTGWTTTGAFTQDAGHIFADTALSGGLSIGTRASAPMRFYTANAEVARFDSSGRLGIGTTSPSEILEIGNSSGGAVRTTITNSNSGATALTELNLRNDYVVGSGLRLMVTSSGYTPSGAYQPDGALFLATGGLTGGLSIGTQGAVPVRFYTGGVADSNERMRIDSSGNIGIGTTTPQERIVSTGGMIVHGSFSSSANLNNGPAAGLGIDATTNLGRIWTDTGSDLAFFIGQSQSVRFTSGGNVGVGTTTPFLRLTVGTGDGTERDLGVFNGSICADNGGNTKCYGSLTAGVVYGDSSSFAASDVAEQYPTRDSTLAPGEIVAMDSRASGNVKRAVYGDAPMGIVSTAPGVLLGDEPGIEDHVAIALAGRVPVLVTMENGAIAAGDRIALSAHNPGKGMKATASGRTVGVALEGRSVAGSVIVFVEPEFTWGEDDREAIASVRGLASSTLASTPVEIAEGSFLDGLMKGIFAEVTRWLASATNGIQKLFAHEVHTDTLCVGATCVTESEFKTLLEDDDIRAAPSSAPVQSPEPPASEEQTPEPASTSTTPADPTPSEQALAPAPSEPAAPVEPTPPPAEVSISSPL